MGFDHRYAGGETFENRFLRAAEKAGCLCRREGTESRQQTEEFKKRLRELADGGDVMAKSIRYSPDFLCLTKEQKLVYYDVKSGISIERESYRELVRREQAGENVYFAYMRENDLVASKPSQLKFLDGHVYNSWNIPIEDGVWRCPRKLPAEKYEEWKAKFGGSGTPLAIINIAQTEHRLLAKKV